MIWLLSLITECDQQLVSSRKLKKLAYKLCLMIKWHFCYNITAFSQNIVSLFSKSPSLFSKVGELFLKTFFIIASLTMCQKATFIWKFLFIFYLVSNNFNFLPHSFFLSSWCFCLLLTYLLSHSSYCICYFLISAQLGPKAAWPWATAQTQILLFLKQRQTVDFSYHSAFQKHWTPYSFSNRQID